MGLASREKYLALREVLWPERIAARSGARHYSRRGVIHICEKEVGKRLLGPLRFSANEASRFRENGHEKATRKTGYTK